MTIAASLGEGPSGLKPRRITPDRVGLYLLLIMSAAFFLLPFYVMMSTSLKTVDEVRLSSALSLPQVPQFVNWWHAWFSACTGQTCNGVSEGFFNTAKITVLATILTLAIASVSGFALTFWRVSWAKPVFLGLLVGAFVPYQVFIYPLIKILGGVGLTPSLATIVLVHTIFQLPVITLIFRNYFSTIPVELYKAARIDGAGFFRIFLQIVLPMSLPIMVVAVILLVTGIWNDYLLGLMFAGRASQPMTVQINAMLASELGTHSYNIEMAAVLLTSFVPLAVYFISGKWFIRGIAAGAVKG
jgi:glucose/mannose transport system permease protein